MIVSTEALSLKLRGAFGQTLEVYKTIDSTNNAAKLLAKNDAPHGSVLVARQQTAGRGRLGRSFFSPCDAGVYFTVILRPAYSAERLALLTPAASVAVVRALRSVCGVSAQIKWVNDVYLHGKKICGILAESAMAQGTPEYTVVGIGVNLVQAAFPPELSKVVTSLEAEGAGETDPNALIAEVLYQLECCMEKGDFMKDYRADSCVLGKTVRVLHGDEEYTAVAKSFDEQAHLRVCLPSGEERVLCSGEISIRGDFTLRAISNRCVTNDTEQALNSVYVKTLETRWGNR